MHGEFATAGQRSLASIVEADAELLERHARSCKRGSVRWAALVDSVRALEPLRERLRGQRPGRDGELRRAPSVAPACIAPVSPARAGTGKAPALEGIACPWYRADLPGSEYDLSGGYGECMERFVKGAFSDALASPGLDVVGLFNHEACTAMGRTGAGLTVRETDAGLFYSFAPVGMYASGVTQLVRARIVRGSSFHFVPETVRWEDKGDYVIRWIEKCNIKDVSPVVAPAYQASTCVIAGSGRSAPTPRAVPDADDLRLRILLAERAELL